MRQGPPERREFAHYITLAQVGMEMVAPIVVGLLLDSSLGWSPWATIVGAVIGLVGGIGHLVALANRAESGNSSQRRKGS